MRTPDATAGGGAGRIDTHGGLRTVVVRDGDAAEVAHQSALQRLMEAVRQGNQVCSRASERVVSRFLTQGKSPTPSLG